MEPPHERQEVPHHWRWLGTEIRRERTVSVDQRVATTGFHGFPMGIPRLFQLPKFLDPSSCLPSKCRLCGKRQGCLANQGHMFMEVAGGVARAWMFCVGSCTHSLRSFQKETSLAILGPLSHTRLRAPDQFFWSTRIGGKGGPGPSLLHTTLEGPTSKRMQDGCKVYMVSYMASNGSCFMVTWTIFKNQFLEVSLTQNRETMAFRMLTIVELL